MPAESFSDDRLDATLVELKPVFKEQFEVKDDSDVEWLLFTFAPGRINFIGEHVDYLGGWVCPAALTEGTHILAGRVKHLVGESRPRMRFFATYSKESYEIEDMHQKDSEGKTWRTYVRGAVTLQLNELALDVTCEALRGVCFVVHSTLSIGAGMSASAAFSVGLLYAVHCAATVAYTQPVPLPNRRYSLIPSLQREALVKFAQQARQVEVEFCGANIGIMDQFAAALSEDNKFMFLDCLSYEYQTYSLAPLLGNNYCFLLVDSMVRHELASGNGSIYNKVREDQEQAERKVSQHVFRGAKDFTFSAFVRHTADFAVDGKCYSEDNRVAVMNDARPHLTTGEYERGCYQLAEQERTLAFKRLNDGSQPDLPQAQRVAQVGALLNSTHAGLRDLLKVSTPELDFIQECVVADSDVAGARVMGAGFGGCVLVLLKHSAKERVINTVAEKFEARFHVRNTFYPIDHLGGGVFSVSLTQ